MSDLRRRPVPSQAELVNTPSATEPSDITPDVPSDIIAKLLGFTLALITVPLGTYFATVNTVFGGNQTFAGATAAILANVILIGYVIVAVMDDKSEGARKEKEKEGKKGQ